MRANLAGDHRYLVVELSPEEAERLLASGGSGLANIPLPASAQAAGQIEEHISERLARHEPIPASLDETRTSRRRRKNLQAAWGYIDDHISDMGLTPLSVAGAIHVSPRYLHSIFRETGSSVAQYIRRRRLEVSRELLAQHTPPTLHISDIARRVGFSDPSHFARVFRLAYGQTPREFRTMVQGGEFPPVSDLPEGDAAGESKGGAGGGGY
ncbi:MAG TPA: helix-turn-helix transcriptional regulator [Nocardioides sp.]|nr:helix-turn-helix transcriptional regulator [Nocardioides sp.]HRI94851.1 helix-turn-helix transcriptional regulator [Nocardioides sp.]HRK44914.1 helix-turn-helix transcriptional regulator [Nocardioides sp.]